MSTRPTTTVDNLTVTLKVPKENITGISVPEFVDKVGTTTQAHTISAMTTDGDDDVITLHWDTFNPASALSIPFTVTVANGQTPDGFVIRPVATISSKQNPTAVSCDPLTIVAKYPDLKLTKSANGQTGTATVVGAASIAKTADGTEYIPENGAALVAFTFSLSAEDTSIRSMSKVELTDELPTYTDYTGATRHATFSQAANPDWKLSGTTLTWTKTGDSNTLADSIPTLRLGFPGLPLDKSATTTQSDGTKVSYEYGTASNSATLTATVADPADGEETERTASAALDLRLATGDAALGGTGFMQVVPYRNGPQTDLAITDTVANKTADFQWGLSATNKLSYAMGDVVLHDEHESTLCGTGSDSCGPDSRLRVTGISSMTIGSLTAQEIASQKIVTGIRAYKEDGTYDTYAFSDTSGTSGPLYVTFDKNTVYTGFSVVLDPDWVWEPGVTISVIASSYLRDPGSVHYTSPDTTSSNKIINRAAASGTLLAETIGSDKKVTLTPAGSAFSIDANDYQLIEFTERLSVGVGFESGSSTRSIGNRPEVTIRISGILDPGIDHSNLRAVAILPAGMEWDSYYSTECGYGTPGEGCSTFVTGRSIVKNYKGTGRTAVIFSLDQAYAKQFLDSNTEARIYLHFYTMITTDSIPGQDANVITAFLTSDNAPDPGNETGFSTYKTLLPSATSSSSQFYWVTSVYPDNYHVGTHTNISASAFAYTVTMNSGIVASQTVESDTAKDSSGILVGPTTKFTYHLSVSDFGDSDYTNLSLFDALPTTGSGGKYGTSAYAVRLSSFPTAPDGYTLLYTTDASVATMDEADAVADSSLWVTQDKVSDVGTVTAVRLVADSGTTLKPNATISLDLPMQAAADPSARPDEGDYTTNTAGGIGLVALRDATNIFSFSARQGTQDVTWKQSNAVYARLDPYAGFVVKKVSDLAVDGKDSPLAGAKLTLAGGTTSAATQTTTKSGALAYYGLQTGTHTLSEDEAPTGYLKAGDMTITVTKTGTTLQMTCTTKTASGSSTTCKGSGTVSDPFVMTDPSEPRTMPETGRPLGPIVLAVSALSLLVLLLASGWILLRPRPREH